jgi:hypothetical protein
VFITTWVSSPRSSQLARHRNRAEAVALQRLRIERGGPGQWMTAPAAQAAVDLLQRNHGEVVARREQPGVADTEVQGLRLELLHQLQKTAKPQPHHQLRPLMAQPRQQAGQQRGRRHRRRANDEFAGVTQLQQLDVTHQAIAVEDQAACALQHGLAGGGQVHASGRAVEQAQPQA